MKMYYILKWQEFLNENNIIGWGSSRKVYDNGDGYVIKKSYEPIGLFQNENEVFLSKRLDVNSILNKVIDYSDDFTWIKTKKANLISDDNITQHIKYFWDLGQYFSNSFINDKHKQYLDNNTFVQTLNILINKYNLTYMDLINYKNYGLVDGKLKLIDFGLTTTYDKDKYESIYNRLK